MYLRHVGSSSLVRAVDQSAHATVPNCTAATPLNSCDGHARSCQLGARLPGSAAETAMLRMSGCQHCLVTREKSAAGWADVEAAALHGIVALCRGPKIRGGQQGAAELATWQAVSLPDSLPCMPHPCSNRHTS